MMTYEKPVSSNEISFEYKAYDEWLTYKTKANISESNVDFVIQNIDYLVNPQIQSKNSVIVRDLIDN